MMLYILRFHRRGLASRPRGMSHALDARALVSFGVSRWLLSVMLCRGLWRLYAIFFPYDGVYI